MSGGGKNNFFHKYGGALSLVSGSPSALWAPVEDIVKKNQVKGQGTTAPGGYANTFLDPADIFGGKKTGEAQQQVKQQAAEQAAQSGAAQSDLDAILAGGSAPQYGANGQLAIGNSGVTYGSMQPSYGSYHPQPVLMPQLLQGPNRTPNQNQMPLLAHQAFSQVLGPLQQPNWGLQQVNPAFLTGEARFANGQVPDGNVLPQGLGQMPQQPTRQTIQPLSQRVWA